MPKTRDTGRIWHFKEALPGKWLDNWEFHCFKGGFNGEMAGKSRLLQAIVGKGLPQKGFHG